MKLFGEYLVEKNHIKEEQLLEALVKQAEEQPPVVKVVRDWQVLSQTEILNCLKEQMLTLCSFVDAARKRGVWKEEFSERLASDLAGLRTPLGEMLVKANCLELSSLTRALDDFFGDRPKVDAEKAPMSPSSLGASSFEEGSASSFPEVFEFLGDKFFLLLQNAIQESSKGKLLDISSIAALADELRKVAGAAKLYGFEEMSEFSQRIEVTLRDLCTRKLEKIGSDITGKMMKALSESNEIFGSLVEANRTGALATDFFSKSPAAPKAKSVSDWLVLVEFDLSSIDQGDAQ